MESGKHLYIIVSKITGSIKIGRSSNVLQRLDSLQTANPYPLKIILIAENQGNIEKDLHKKLKKFKTNGEWFLLAGLHLIGDQLYEQIDLDAMYDFVGLQK